MRLEETSHRPWPMPARPWTMRMIWSDLLFAHWAVDPALVRPYVPPGLELDCWQGEAWLGVVPFAMRGIRLRGVPPVPGTSAFLELNLRTYVTDGRRPGVYFFSLDAASRAAVRAARLGFHLPYFDARMSLRRGPQGWLYYSSERTHRGAAPGRFLGRYRPVGEPARAVPGSLEHWLTERYCLYAVDRGRRVWRGEIHHEPWPLHPAELELMQMDLDGGLDFRLEGPPRALHFAPHLEVVAWDLDPVSAP